ncbi:hypothetical protein Q3G72_032779 [Acer saccharum]|nr:hypothetical protein Q3G72_032779 [Acer saccharum]
MGMLSKVEDLSLLSLLEKVADTSPVALASASLPIFLVAMVAVVVITDDSAGLVVLQGVVVGALRVDIVGLFVGPILLDGLQEAD